MRRYIESALRLRVRIILSALLVFGLASASLYFSKQGYSSSATIWVEKPPYYTFDQLGWNPYVSPAANQAGKFGELLRTQQFALSIARAAGIPFNTVAEQGRVLDEIQTNLHVVDFGDRLIKVTYNSSDPEYCEPVVRQAIKLFGEEMTATSQIINQTALGQYEQQVVTAQKDLNRSKAAFELYLRENPELDLGSPDPTLRELNQQFALDSQKVDQIQGKIDETNNRIVSDTQLVETIWRMRDQPEAAEPYQMTIKDLLRNSVVAMMMAFLAAFAIILVGTWTDSAVYTLNDVSTVALGEQEGTSPELLVGIVPFIAPLGAIRKQAHKEERAIRKRQRGPSVRVLDDTEIVPRNAPEPNITRPSDALAQR